jgi:two-component system, LytTR family, sensor kinase
MRPRFSRATPIKAGAIIAAWTIYALLSAWQAHSWHALGKMPMSWADCFRFEFTFAGLWALATPGVLFVSRRFRLERHLWPPHLLLHVASILVLVPVIKTAYDAIAMPPLSPFHHFTWLSLFRSVEADFDTGTLFYAVILLVEHALSYYGRYQSGLIKASQLQTQLVQAQLQALKMQLHPHFLFNTLHSVTAMVHEDPDMAERTITRLSELLRLFLANRAIHEVPLNEELRILDLYLEIERARFEDRLRVHYDVPPALENAIVPSLLLQPLVENAIRHGLSRRAEQGWISINAELFGETLVIRVTDNGIGFAADARHSGLGLPITRGRLESLYGARQSLVLRNLPAGGVEARITLPFRICTRLEGSEDHVELQSHDR